MTEGNENYDNLNSKNENTTEDKTKTASKIKNTPKKNDKNTLFLSTIKSPTRQIDLSYFNNFPGFFNKNFNLTSFKKEKENSRSLSRSPEKRLPLPTQVRGNGIPLNCMERLKFLNKIFKSNKFKKVYNQTPKRYNSSFEEFCDFIIKYSKKNSVLDAIILSYYYICHEIKYDDNINERTEYNLKISQQPETVFENGLALSIGFTNIFEHILKKLDVRFKHIDGYCKYLSKDNNNQILNFHTTKNSQTNIGEMNNTSSDGIHNTSNIDDNNENTKININLKKNNINNNTNNRNSNKFLNYSTYNNNLNNTSINYNTSKYLKTLPGYENEQDNINEYINHCWDAFYFKGQWYFADLLLGSGSVEIQDIIDEQNQQPKSKDIEEIFNFFYLMPEPNYLIYSHFPNNDDWQLSDKIWTFKQFLQKKIINYAKFLKGVVKYDVELLSHNDPFIYANLKEKLFIKLRIQNFVIDGNLYNAIDGHKLGEVKFSYEQKTKIFILEPVFQKTGEYIIRINLRALDSTDLLYRPLFDYRIKVSNNLKFNYFEKYGNMKQNLTHNEKDKIFDDILPKITQPGHKIISDYNKIFPTKKVKKVCYDNEGFYLFEPRSNYLKKGVVTKFKVKIKGAQNASLLDGNHWIGLKRVEDNIYEGQKKIINDDVSICCLRDKNVFTEVFKFRPRKSKYEISRSTNINHGYLKNKKFD